MISTNIMKFRLQQEKSQKKHVESVIILLIVACDGQGKWCLQDIFDQRITRCNPFQLSVIVCLVGPLFSPLYGEYVYILGSF